MSVWEKDLQLANELEMKKLEVQMRELGSPGRAAEFDIARCICFVPLFNKEDVDKYNVLYEGLLLC